MKETTSESIIDTFRRVVDEEQSELIEFSDGTTYDMDPNVAELLIEKYDQLSSFERNGILERLSESLESFLTLAEEIGIQAETQEDDDEQS